VAPHPGMAREMLAAGEHMQKGCVHAVEAVLQHAHAQPPPTWLHASPAAGAARLGALVWT